MTFQALRNFHYDMRDDGTGLKLFHVSRQSRIRVIDSSVYFALNNFERQRDSARPESSP